MWTDAKRILSLLIFLYLKALHRSLKKKTKKYVVNQRQCYSEKNYFQKKLL